MVNAASIEDIARGIIRIVQDADLRADLIQKGTDLCRNLTWKKVAEEEDRDLPDRSHRASRTDTSSTVCTNSPDTSTGVTSIGSN